MLTHILLFPPRFSSSSSSPTLLIDEVVSLLMKVGRRDYHFYLNDKYQWRSKAVKVVRRKEAAGLNVYR